MKRVLLLTNELNSSNGWATLGYELYQCLTNILDLVVLTEQDADNEITTDKVLPLLPPQKGKVYLLLRYVYLFLTLPIHRVDVIVCNVERSLPLAVLLKLRFRCPVILLGAGTYIYYPFVASSKKILTTLLLRHIDRLVVISHYTKKRVREFYHGEIEVITLGVNTTRYFPLAHVPKELAFVFVGELKKRKGIQYLLQAFERVLQDVPTCKLYCVGATQLYEKRLQDLACSEHIVFTGKISHEELLAYYSRAIAHVLPSVNTKTAFEGFGLVHLEANACGIPTIGSRDCGNEDAIVDGVTGFLCPQKDVDCLYQKMKLLATNQALRERMGRQAFEYARTHTWDVVGQKFLQVIEHVAG